MTDQSVWQENYKRFQTAVDAALFQTLPAYQEEGRRQLGEAMQYCVRAGGKRIRPILALATGELLDGAQERIMPFACAIELIHTYSLIHDDLPCMDDDAFRRGQPTCHRVYGEDIALLAGDALLNLAFEQLFDAVQEASESHAGGQDASESWDSVRQGPQDIPVAAVRAAALIAKASGASGMAGGQAIDLKGNVRSLEQLQTLHNYKTGQLILAPVLSAAILFGADRDQYRALESYAQNIGLAFQIRDDLLDVTGNAKKMGKDTGRDKTMNKTTFISLLGLTESGTYLDETVRRAIAALSIFGERAAFLCGIARFIADREY